MKKADFEKIPPELRDEFNKITFLPLDEANAQLKVMGSQNIKNAIVKKLVEDETDRRVDLLSKALKKLDELTIEYAKFQPDNPGGYDANGVKLPDTYKPETGQKRAQTFSKMKQLLEAINLATHKDKDTFSFDALDKVMK